MTRTFNYICACLLLFSFDVYSKLIYRSDYKSTENGYYKIHLPAEFREARLRCHLEGAFLASPLDDDLLSQFQSTFKKLQRCIYTGIHATFSKGDYYSTEGIPLSSMPVVMDSSNNEDCVVFTENNVVTDVNCTEILPYMCYKKNNQNLSVTECGTTDIAYKLDNRTESCYKFHSTPNTWSRAFMTCAAEGGNLAIINSEAEAQVIREVYAKYSDDVVKKYVAFIGNIDREKDGIWLTVQGQTLSEAGYNKWRPGQPDNASGSQFCGGIHRNGLLDDIWCHERFPFICEKNPSALRPDL